MPSLTPPSAVSHIAFCVRDMEKSLGFYRDLVGCEVVKDEVQNTSTGGLPHVYRDAHASRRVVYLKCGDGRAAPILVVTEHPGETVSGEAIMLDQVGISHLSFTVPDVTATTQYLLDHGVETCGPADAFRTPDGRIRTVFVRDPDGMLVQFDEGL